MHKRSVIIHGLPPFVSKKAIDDSLWYLLGLCSMKPDDIVDAALPHGGSSRSSCFHAVKDIDSRCSSGTIDFHAILLLFVTF